MRNERILLVDDEEGILNMLKILLEKEGFREISLATTGAEAVSIIQSSSFDLIVLDVMLPDTDGFELCRKLRHYTNIPILFVTARSSDLDKLMGLGIGGDDYITKPFNPLEVIARIHVQLRRQKIFRESVQQEPIKWDFGSFVIYKDEGRLSVEGKQVHCTAKEFELLTFLCSHPNRIYTAGQLYENVWGLSLMGDEKTVVIHISKLRKKIEADPKNPKFIVNLRGIGYKFTPPNRGEGK